MVIGTDPVAAGLAASFSHPGRNLTGVHTLGGDTTLIQKRLELLKELAPEQKRIGVMIARNVGNPIFMGETKAAARALNLDVRFAEVASPGDIEERLGELIQTGSRAIYVTGSTMLASRAALIVEAIAKHRVPAIYATERYADVGGVMTYSASIRKAFVRAGVYVERILKGARPGDLAIERVSDVELVLNMKTAKALDIKVPQSILMRADRVIQ
jgi:putative ABC transport system substrate-binding protein